jgi:anti-sigma factor RsiW
VSGCRRHGEEIGAWLDAELGPAEARVFEAHLSDCRDCEAAVAAQREVDLGLVRLPRVEPSPQFEARFWARLTRASETGSGWRLQLAALGLAAAGVLALVWLVGPGDPALPERDWQIVAESDFDLLMDSDHEILWELDELEAWDGSEEI